MSKISSERALALADREEAERLLSSFLDADADGMEVAWRTIFDMPDGADEVRISIENFSSRYSFDTDRDCIR